jgi:streptogramin lyase
MREFFRDDSRRRKGDKRKPVRLLLEELEGRCLLSTGFDQIGRMAVGPDGNIWFAEGSSIGSLNPSTGLTQEFSLLPGNQTSSIAIGSDGNLWFVADSIFNYPSNGRIGRINPTTGVITEFNLPLGDIPVGDIISSSDGAIWTIDGKEPRGGLLRFDPASGTLKQFWAKLGGYFGGSQLAAGPNGDVWVLSGSLVALINPQTGAVQEFSDLANEINSKMEVNPSGERLVYADFIILDQRLLTIEAGFPILHITSGADGSAWVMADNGPQSFVFQVDPTTGSYKEFDISEEMSAQNLEIKGVVGSDGNLWLSNFSPIAQFNPTDGSIHSYSIMGIRVDRIGQMIVGPDGNLWFPNIYSNGDQPEVLIGQFNPTTGSFQEFGRNPTPGAYPPAPVDDPLSANGTTVKATAGIDFSNVLATFSDTAPTSAQAGSYTATINWEDGSFSNGVITANANGGFDVSGTHNYVIAGPMPVWVTIDDNDTSQDLGGATITVFTIVEVSPAESTWQDPM